MLSPSYMEIKIQSKLSMQKIKVVIIIIIINILEYYKENFVIINFINFFFCLMSQFIYSFILYLL
jgi:hypothetical protein